MSDNPFDRRSDQKEKSAAARFQRHPGLEKLRAMMKADHTFAATVPPGLKMQLGYYLKEKAAAKRAGNPDARD